MNKYHPSYVWDPFKVGYYVLDDNSSLPTFLTNDLGWTCKFKFRGSWETVAKAIKAYNQWEREWQKRK